MALRLSAIDRGPSFPLRVRIRRLGVVPVVSRHAVGQDSEARRHGAFSGARSAPRRCGGILHVRALFR